MLKKVWNRIYPLSHSLFYLQRLVTGPRNRMALASFFAKRLPVLPKALQGQYPEVDLLEKNGFVMLPDLINADVIAEILDWLRSKPVYDRWKSEIKPFSSDSPPADCHTAPYLDSDVINCPHVLRLANDPQVLSIVGQLFGAKPTLSNLTIWWSYPGHNTPQAAENFHRDVDDLYFIKLFIYLTDVDEGCGPHVFVPTSHRHEGFTKIRRYTDDEVAAVFGEENIKYFTGHKGTSFLENTFGLHKGQLPTSGRRLLLQAQYSLHPIGIYKYFPAQFAGEIDGLSLDPYINRLYIRK